MGEMMELIQVAAIGIVMWLLTTILKQSKMDVIANVVSIVGVIIVLIMTAKYILEFFHVVETMFTL
ncbi:MAG: SpoIIIAC/SpoIIIAD family protein [Cellulosilyticaceae bacterium]